MNSNALLEKVRETAERLGLSDDDSHPLLALEGLQKVDARVGAGNGQIYRVLYDVPETASGISPVEAMTEKQAFAFADELGIPRPVLVGGGIWQCLAMITPRHALRWLTRFNIDNRNVHPTNMKKMVRDIKSGRWRLTHQGIAMSMKPAKISRDGQHRLLAILMAAAELKDEGEMGIAVPMMVTLNLSKEAAQCIDGGTLRTVHDRSVLAGGAVIKQRWVSWIKACRIGLAQKAAYSDDELVAWGQISKHNRALRALDELAPRNIGGVTTGAVMGAILRAYLIETAQHKLDRLDQFVKVLLSGDPGPVSNVAALNLRDRLLSKKKLTGRQKYVLTEQAIIAFWKKDPLGTGKIPKQEFFPTKKDSFEAVVEAPEEKEVAVTA